MKTKYDRVNIALLREAALDPAPLSLGPRRTDSPHEFYRYPARFSPRFAAAAINCFSRPGDVVLDPFVGGGTTAVEGQRLGRRVIAADLNPIATFVTRAKTAALPSKDRAVVQRWLSSLATNLNVRSCAPSFDDWAVEGYFKDLGGPGTWRLRKIVGLALATLPRGRPLAARFCRCVVLRTAQWALDMRSVLPSATEFRSTLVQNGSTMLHVMESFAVSVRGNPRPVVVDAGLPGLAKELKGRGCPMPTLVVTSPPYPGVYVNYHRWKLWGRREIPALYWIANTRDGNGLAHYTMSARAEPTLRVYFDRLRKAFGDLATIVGPNALVVQMVGFNDPSEQLPRYLETMGEAGFREVEIDGLSNSTDGRLWRSVPGRRWWAEATARKRTVPHTAHEVVLIHRLASTN
jgi:hypothetical protein